MTPSPAVPRERLHGKVLCIEDQPASMDLVEAMIGALPGLTLLKAATGRDGVRLALAERPDVVLLDMHLPDIDGLEVVRALDRPIAEGRLRVILLTADSFSMDVIKAMSLGAQEYWVKPVSLDRLVAGLQRALG